MKYGTLYAYWTHEWKGDYKYFANKVAKIGFDILEISAGDLLKMTDQEIDELKALTKELGINITSNIGPAKDKDVASKDPAVRQAGIEFLTAIMEKMDRLDSRSLVGVLYTFWPNDFEDLDKPAIWARGVESLKTLCQSADKYNVDLCLEVVNRFETHILNTAEEAVEFCKQVDHPRCKLLMDTFHMNIEEDNIADGFRTAGKYLGQVHLGEGNRKLPGQGHLPWDEIGQALREIGFNGNVVMEPFMMMGGQVGKDIKVWRDLSKAKNSVEFDNEIKASLEFLKTKFE